MLVVLLGVSLAPSTGRARPPAAERLALEPGVTEVQRAARDRHRRLAALLDVAAQNLAWAHALPTRLAVRLARYDERDLSGTLTADGGWRRRTDHTDRLTWRVDVEWNLARLAAHPAALGVARHRADAQRRADAAVDLATRLYFERRALQLEYLSGPPPDPSRAIHLWTRIGELTARLDALTDGLLTRAAIRWWRE